jgi:hypothetical protein
MDIVSLVNKYGFPIIAASGVESIVLEQDFDITP